MALYYTNTDTLSHIHTITSSPTAAVTPVALCVQHNDLYSQLKSYKGNRLEFSMFVLRVAICVRHISSSVYRFILKGRER